MQNIPRLPAIIVAAAIFFAVFADFLVPHSPIDIDLAHAQMPPAVFSRGDWRYPLGTDRLGRDILSRIVVGTRTSLGIAVTAILIGGAIGTALGIIAGYWDGWLGVLIMRTADAFLAFPSLLFALVLAITIGPGFWIVVFVLALALWARFARLIRSEVITIKNRDFVLLARVSGAGNVRIIRWHLLPNIANTLIVLCTLQIGWAIIVEASLTFLGAGVPPPTPTWGGMVAEGLNYIETAWWISVIPGLTIMLVVFSFNLVGDWVRDFLDPQLRNI